MVNLFYFEAYLVAVPFSKPWIEFFCPTMCVTIMLNAIKPYISIIVNLMVCRCEEIERNKIFPIGKRNLQLILLIWNVSSYGCAMPSLFLFAFLSLAI